MKANKFAAKIRDKNRITIPMANINALCKELSITKDILLGSVITVEIRTIISNMYRFEFGEQH